MTDITKGTVASKQGTGNDTLSVTCNGIKRGLLVFINIIDPTAGDRALTIDYDGDALTRKNGGAYAGNNAETEAWFLVNPNSGANTLTFSFAGAILEYQIFAIPLQNVDQANPVNTSNETAGSGTSRSVSVTTTIDRCQLYSLLGADSGISSVSPDGGETSIGSELDALGDAHISEEDAVVTPAGAETMGWSWTSSEANSVVVVAMAPTVELNPTGIASAEAIGIPVLTFDTLLPTGIVSAEAIGVPRLRLTISIPDQRPVATTPGLADYKVRLKNQAGDLVAEFDSWKSLAFTHMVNEISLASLELNADDTRTDLFELDGQMEIWRRNLAVNLDWYLEWEGFYRTPHDFFEQNDNNTFIAYAVGYLDLTRRAHIMWFAGSSEANKTNVGETVMKAYVSENIGALALAANGRIADHIFTGLAVQADLGAGATWQGDRAFENLLDVLQEISLQSQLDFDIVGTGDATYQFQVYELRGIDRTTDGLVPATGLNGAGNVPIIFSTTFGNMAVPAYSFDRMREKNKIYVLGAGQVDERDISTIREDLTLQDDSPWNKIEGVATAGQELDDDALNAIGDSELSKNKPIENIAFKAKQIRNIYYGKDFSWGDRITARYKTFEFNKTIMGVRITVNDQVGGERIDLDFGERDSPKLMFEGITGDNSPEQMRLRQLFQLIGGEMRELFKFFKQEGARPDDTVYVKNTTGDFAVGREGMRVVNTVDGTYKIYTDGAWRQLFP